MRLRVHGGLLGLLTAAVLAFGVPVAHAAFGIAKFDAAVVRDDDATAGDPYGTPATQAAEHPYKGITDFTFNTTSSGAPDGNVEDIRVDIPPGLISNPQALPHCTDAQLTTSTCPVASQVGTEELTALDPVLGLLPLTLTLPLYNMTLEPGQIARFSFYVPILSLQIDIDGGLRDTSDYGQFFTISDIPSSPQLISSKLTFWGVPAAASHDAERGRICVLVCAGGGLPSTAAPIPFLTLPTGCVPPQTTRMTAVSHAGDRAAASSLTRSNGVPIGSHGCESVPFDPAIAVTPATRATSAIDGFGVDLHVPQPQDPAGLGEAHVQRAVVALPPGVALSPSAANGLRTCSAAQIGIGTHQPVTCPAASRLGTVAIASPPLATPLTGTIYLGPTRNGRPDQIFLVADGYGLSIRLGGHVSTDDANGQVTATFADLPPVPFSDVVLTFDGGAHGALVNPVRCGSYTTATALTPWSTSPAHPRLARPSHAFAIDQGCAPAFVPTLATASSTTRAGSYTSFTLGFGRPDRQQQLRAMTASLPGGLLGALKGFPLCDAAHAAAGACQAASRVGSVRASAGPGPDPVSLPGTAYLTAPLRKGDAAGMSIVVPARVGPFDLGRVVTRAFLHIRSTDAGIDVIADPLPTIQAGVPLQLRDVRVTVDRSRFLFTPTRCGAAVTRAAFTSQLGAHAGASSQFTVGDCARLPFSPRATVRAGGRGKVTRSRHPALTVIVRAKAGQANLAATNVVLPRALNVDLRAPALRKACPPDVYARDACSKIATIGRVKATTPLLAEPLRGPAFLRQRPGELPDLIMRLRNAKMAIDLVGRLDFLKDGRLITRVRPIPDAPISAFEIVVRGGRGGSLLNRGSLCRRPLRTAVTFGSQNHKNAVVRARTAIVGCARRAERRRSARAHKRAHAAHRRAERAARRG